MEAIVYAGLLTESQRIDYVLKHHGEALGNKFTADVQAHAVPADIQAEVEALQGETIGEKVVAYIAERDPTRKQLYTLWMAIRYLKGDVPLEDLYGMTEYIEVFEQNKTRFQIRDINQYRSVPQFTEAVMTFMASMADVSAPSEQLQNDNDIQVVYDSPRLTIAKPKSVQGAIMLAGKTSRNSAQHLTTWCTGWPGHQNRYAAYAARGPIFVIIDKQKNSRWQFFFDQQQPQYSEFMDRSNARVNLAAFLDEYPAVFQVIGETLFSPHIAEAGLGRFSPEAVKQIPAHILVDCIHSVNDLAAFPPEKANNPEMAVLVIAKIQESDKPSDGKQSIIAYYLKRFPDEFFTNLLPVYPRILRYLPPRFQTEENKVEVGSRLETYRLIEDFLPKPWPEVINEAYWVKRVQHDSALRMKDVPERFRSPSAVKKLLLRTPSDIKDYTKYLTQDIVEYLVGVASQIVDHLPEEYLNAKTAAVLATHIKNEVPSYSFKAEHATEAMVKYFKPSDWPAFNNKQMCNIIRQAATNKDFTWDDFPEAYKRHENVVYTWLKVDPMKIVQIPAEYDAEKYLKSIIRTGTLADWRLKEVFAKLADDVLTESVLVDIIRGASASSSLSWNGFPKRLHTVAVARAMMDRSALAVSEMPESLVTPEYLVARIRYHGGEAKNVPPAHMNSGLAAQIARVNPNAIAGFPDRVLTEDVLFNWEEAMLPAVYNPYAPGIYKIQEAFSGAREQFKRFPEKAMSHRTLALAFELGLIAADPANIPDHLSDHETIGSLLGKAPHHYGAVSDRTNEEALVKAVRRNISILSKAPKEKLTEPVVFAALERWARAGTDADRVMLKNTPKASWSKRCYEAAVGYVVTLDEVPSRWRSPQIKIEAVKRDPNNIVFIDDIGAWMGEHAKEVTGDKKWLAKLSNAGVFKVGRHWVAVKDMDSTPLKSGGSFVVIPTGPSNFRVYLLDRKGRTLVQLRTKENKFEVEGGAIFDRYVGPAKLKEVAPQLVELIKETPRLQEFSMNVLNWVGLYNAYDYSDGKRREFVRTEDELPHKPYDRAGKAIEWAEAPHLDGNLYLGFINGKKVIRIVTAERKAMYGKSRTYVDDVDLFVKPGRLFKYSKDIAAWADYHLPTNGWSAVLRNIGVVFKDKAKDWVSLLDKKITEVDDLQVWRAGDTISVWHAEKGYLGKGTLRKNGKITGTDVSRDHSKFTSKVHDVFAAMEGKIPV